ncbi:MAG TPA: hypothetical protein PLZ93_01490 [Nocardioides sp.]|uniref:hypothetical protein n=1 Tax=uncultured Nocardioides sp. TaxID=198441 RepID=UPI000ED6C2DE|nr:hypothetical protein [uncultured Nocardioides sp.]HCB06179.1 hypothetical protein [Nocardioides sp.]HRD60146.1 hypothetical protein [Nocardioides sp.]HRI94267.1 hypothetical protein [Nocardioides sp.]HRK45361.1 hypothetical protein [Nocardioides sp.]
MNTALVVVLVAVGAAVLLALAWWSSGRARGVGYRTSGAHESAKGLGTAQGGTHNPPGSQGGLPF